MLHLFRRIEYGIFFFILLVSCAHAERLVWDANAEPEVIGYKVHRGLSSGQYNTVVDVGNVTEYQLVGLDPTKTYYFAVTAYSATQESGYSNEAIRAPPAQGIASASNVHITWKEAVTLVAISITHKAAGVSTTNPLSITTYASSAPPANTQIIVSLALSITNGTSSDADDITLSGCGLTWTKRKLSSFGSRRQIYVFSGIAASPTTGNIGGTLTLGGANIFEQFKWSIEEASGVDSSTPFGTSNTGIQLNGLSLTVTVTGTPDAGDFVFFAGGLEDNNDTSINSELDTDLYEYGDATGARHFHVAYDSSPDSTPIPGIDWSGYTSGGAIAFIINVGAAGGASSFILNPLQSKLFGRVVR